MAVSLAKGELSLVWELVLLIRDFLVLVLGVWERLEVLVLVRLDFELV